MKIHKVIARYFGYDLRRLNRDHLTIQTHLFNLFNLLDINCVIDVGANCGQYGTMLREYGYSKRIVSFEPVSASFDKLNRLCINDKNWFAYKFALGAQNTSMQINVADASELTSFHNPNEYSKDFFGDQGDIKYTEKVEVRRLDDLLPEIVKNIDDPKIYLKMDTQGYDLEVLKGAESSVERVLGLQSELSVIPIYQQMPDYIQSLSKFREMGFEVTGLYPIVRDKSLVVIEFDCVMRKFKSLINEQ